MIKRVKKVPLVPLSVVICATVLTISIVYSPSASPGLKDVSVSTLWLLYGISLIFDLISTLLK